MKIFEILLPPTQYAAGNILAKAGYKKLGGGVYGAAYAKPNTPYILKLFKTDDQAYVQYLKLITTISNPHFPVVKGKPRRINDEYYAVRLETLKELPTSYYPLGRACSKYAQKYYELKNKEFLRFINSKNPNLRNQKLKSQQIDTTRSQLTTFEDTYPELAEALRLIVDHVIAPHHHYIDMHPGNFLLRGSTIIITDPATGRQPAIDLPDELKSPKQLEFPWSKTSPTSSSSSKQSATSSPAVTVFDPPKPHGTDLISLQHPQAADEYSSDTWKTHETPVSPSTPTHFYLQTPNDAWSKKSPTPNSEEYNELAHKLFHKSWNQLNFTQRQELKAALTFQQ